MKPSTIYMLSLGAGLLACTPSIEDYPAELEEAFCAWQHACHQYERPGECIEANALESDPDYTYLAAAVVQGNVEYDRDAAAACLDAIRERSCTFEDDAKSVCDGVFHGRIGRNGPCLSTAECAGNAVCGFEPNCADMCCVGACRVFADPVKIGEPCSFGGVGCEEDAFCANDPITFIPTVCTARVEAGGDCSLGQPCVDTAACDGSECRKIELRAPGEQCSGEFIACEEPGVCSGFEGAEPPVCVVAAELGAPCDFDIPCIRFDTFCDENSKLCTLLPGPGQGCFQFSCLPYAECESESNFDVDMANTGARCVARLGAGEACAEDGSGVGCLGALDCIDGTCALPVVEAGEVCAVPDAG